MWYRWCERKRSYVLEVLGEIATVQEGVHRNARPDRAERLGAEREQKLGKVEQGFGIGNQDMDGKKYIYIKECTRGELILFRRMHIKIMELLASAARFQTRRHRPQCRC